MIISIYLACCCQAMIFKKKNKTTKQINMQLHKCVFFLEGWHPYPDLGIQRQRKRGAWKRGVWQRAPQPSPWLGSWRAVPAVLKVLLRLHLCYTAQRRGDPSFCWCFTHPLQGLAIQRIAVCLMLSRLVVWVFWDSLHHLHMPALISLSPFSLVVPLVSVTL